jgi:hypothetical protein
MRRRFVVASHDGRLLVGLIGAGVGASLSPALHEREGDADPVESTDGRRWPHAGH